MTRKGGLFHLILITMRKLNYFIFIACAMFCISTLGVCVNDENETLVSIDIQDICRVYTLQQVKMTLNGECEGSL